MASLHERVKMSPGSTPTVKSPCRNDLPITPSNSHKSTPQAAPSPIQDARVAAVCATPARRSKECDGKASGASSPYTPRSVGQGFSTRVIRSSTEGLIQELTSLPDSPQPWMRGNAMNLDQHLHRLAQSDDEVRPSAALKATRDSE